MDLCRHRGGQPGRRRFGIRVDADGIEDTMKKAGRVPWDTVRDVETHNVEESQVLKLVVGGDRPSTVEFDLSQLPKEDQQDLYETILRFWSKRKAPGSQSDS